MYNYLRVILILLSVSFLSLAFAQSVWVEQTNPLGFGEEAMLGKVHFVSAAEGWIAVHDGRFLHTTNGGSNWEIIDPSINVFYNCFFTAWV